MCFSSSSILLGFFLDRTEKPGSRLLPPESDEYISFSFPGLTQTGLGKHELGPGGIPVGDLSLIPVKGFIQTSANFPHVAQDREEASDPHDTRDPLLDPRDLSIPPSFSSESFWFLSRCVIMHECAAPRLEPSKAYWRRTGNLMHMCVCVCVCWKGE